MQRLDLGGAVIKPMPARPTSDEVAWAMETLTRSGVPIGKLHKIVPALDVLNRAGLLPSLTCLRGFGVVGTAGKIKNENAS